LSDDVLIGAVRSGQRVLAALKKETVVSRRLVLIEALTALAEAGIDLHLDLHLSQALADEDALARERVALALGAVTTAQNVKAAVAALSAALVDRHVGLRRQAARSLGRLAQLKNDAVAGLLKKQAPALENALGERDRLVSVESALALWRITHQADKALPVLLEDLKSLSYEGPN